MGEFIYCMSNPKIPGVIRIDAALTDPREAQVYRETRGHAQRIDWTVRVADSVASKRAVDQELAPFAEQGWSDHFRCDPMRARAAAIKFTTVRTPEQVEKPARPALPSLVLGLGLAVQFLGMSHGATGPSMALVAAALFWVVYTMPMGSGGKMNAA